MKIVTKLTGQIDADGFLARAELDDGTELALVPLLLGRARVTLGPPSPGFPWMTYEHGW